MDCGSQPPRRCQCPSKLQKLCCKRAITSHKDVADILSAMEYANYIKRHRRRVKKYPKFKKSRSRLFRPVHHKESCVPMRPSMHTRLQYIGHCPIEPSVKPCTSTMYKRYTFQSSSEETICGRRPRIVCGKRMYRPGDVRLAPPVHVVKHTDDDQFIFSVPSPRTSGEVIAAQRAAVKPSQWKPPLPPKSGFDLHKPHSGIVINREFGFLPEIVHDLGLGQHVPGPSPKGQGSRCPKGGFCGRKSCSRKKCRMIAAMKNKRMGRIGKAKSDMFSMVGHARKRGPSAKKRWKCTHKKLEQDDPPCGLDDVQRPDHVQVPPELKRGTFKTHSLTIVKCSKEKKTPAMHFGILNGSLNMYDSKFGAKSRGRQALAMSVMAYCLAFHYHPKQWTLKLLDNLLNAGDQWYQQCLDKVHDHSAVQGMCEVLPFGKKQTLVLNRKKMLVLLCEPDIIGYTMSLDPTVYNLCRGLKAFFNEPCNRAGILLTRIIKVAIWKDKICYYVFDPAGRNPKAFSNFASGTSALMTVIDLEGVAELLLTRSVIEDQKFVLAPIKVLRMIDEKADEDLESDKEPTQAEKAMMGYRILNENCAIVNANMHLGERCFEDAKYRQALPIAVVAMTYAKISPPNTWYSKTLDKILRLGNRLYMDCADPRVMIDLSIDNIPNEIVIGPYACEIIIYRERVKGQLFTTKECLLNIRRGLEEFFNKEYSSGILEFNNYTLAIWRQKEMYYLFDPYPRTNDGLRSMTPGKACCLMLLNPDGLADALIKNWDFLPATNQYYIHAFKVLKLRKKEIKSQITCTLSDDELPGAGGRKRPRSGARGDGKEYIAAAAHTPAIDVREIKAPGGPDTFIDEEQMGDIISLVDSIQEDYVPPVPTRYKNLPDEPEEPRIVNLDSPTVSVTQVVPPWPQPRDKSNEPIEPDPDPDPTPPPTPPPPPPPEGAEEEEAEDEDDEDDEEAALRKKEEAARKKAEEEEARRKAEELPPEMPPPPPTPQLEPEPPLAPLNAVEELEILEPKDVKRKVLLTEDAKSRFKLRQQRKKMASPLIEDTIHVTPSEELVKPHNFLSLPDGTQIIRGSMCLHENTDILPFASIMAIVTSYKYTINSWTPGLVNFVVETSRKLYENKKEKFQLAPVHIIPKIGIGHQSYKAQIDVVAEGATWQLEDVLARNFLRKHDRGMVTTSTYSCAFFKKNGLYYMYDGSPCNALGMRTTKDKGKACLMRFRNIHDMVARINYNKDGRTEDQQFILSSIVVRSLMQEARYKLPEDYNFDTRSSKSKAKATYVKDDRLQDKSSRICGSEPKQLVPVGYQCIKGTYKIPGTTAVSCCQQLSSLDVKACHFVSLVAMLMAAMHPIASWDQVMVDTCVEKGVEIYKKATNLAPCEKRVIRNVILDGKFININIKKITVINENVEKRLEQYLRAIFKRLRYVIIKFSECSMVICQSDGFLHLFDPYAFQSDGPAEQPPITGEEAQSVAADDDLEPGQVRRFPDCPVASWTLFRSVDSLARRLRREIPSADNPDFYTFELTSVKPAPKHAALNYRLSPLFKPDVNPNEPYTKRSRSRPAVDEKMYWLNIEAVPWTRMSALNDLGFPRRTPKTLWRDWDIEFPGDLYSLWGTMHPMDVTFAETTRGKQYLCVSAVALAMTEACCLAAWTASFIDGIVVGGNEFFKKCLGRIGDKKNHEMVIEDLNRSFDDMFPYSMSFGFKKVIYGFVYNLYPDRFNLAKALSFFFEGNRLGILTSPSKNLAFGRTGNSYFMFDCQSFGAPIFCPGQGSAYILKCESLNRLIYCITVTLNLRKHGQQFHLYSVSVSLTERGYSAKKDGSRTDDKEKEDSEKAKSQDSKTSKQDSKTKPDRKQDSKTKPDHKQDSKTKQDKHKDSKEKDKTKSESKTDSKSDTNT